MKNGRASNTAQAAAALRANHLQNASSPVFSDPFAVHMTNPFWKYVLKAPFASKLLNTKLSNLTLGRLTGQVVARSRYAEDLLLQAVQEKNIQQYVIVGAGLDSFSLRLAAQFPALKVFEVDHPATQNFKIKTLQRAGSPPSNVEFVSINFELESLSTALNSSSFNPAQPAFFSWLGTTHYLSPQTTLATLANIASISAAHSELVLDYSIPYRTLSGLERFGSQAVAQFTQLLKEPLIGAFEPAQLHSALQDMGFKLLEDLSGKAITQKYFQNRTDHIQHTHATHLLHIERA